MVDGIGRQSAKLLKNGDELPVVIIGGCHNAQFNVTFMNLIMGFLKHGIDYYKYWGGEYGEFWLREWIPNDLSSGLLFVKGGGSIATMSNTGIGYGDGGLKCLQHREGWLSVRFFEVYVNQSINILGNTHSQAIIDYINIIGGVNIDRIDRKTIEEWVLLGDPSLKMGGY
jgi:hypothetical protein